MLTIQVEHLEIHCTDCQTIFTLSDGTLSDKERRRVTCPECGKNFIILHTLQVMSTDMIRSNSRELLALVMAEDEILVGIEEIRAEIESEDSDSETGGDKV